MIKRAALARALALDPQLLFLDEPTSGLDPISAAAFDDLIAYLQQELQLTVVMITHDLDTIFRICDRVGVIVDRKMMQDTRERIVDHPHPWIQLVFPWHAGGALRRDGERHAWSVKPTTPRSAPSCILVTVMAGLFVYWYSDGRDRRNYEPYEIYFDGSVTGLSEGGLGALPGRGSRAACAASASTSAAPSACR